MKLNRLSTTQFAGLRNLNLSFREGLNVVCGKNESGKSTLANLLSRTLFQSPKLDLRSDKEFLRRYFPAERRDGRPAGDFIDGTAELQTGEGTLVLTKRWGADSRCVLSSRTATLRDPAAVTEELHRVLGYGEGVFAELLLPTQRGSDLALQTLLDAARQTEAKRELTDVVTRAFAQSDGVSLEELSRGIEEKIKALAGSHWDIEAERPMRKNGRWSANLGSVLTAWYALEDAKLEAEKLERMERELDEAAKQCGRATALAEQREQEYFRFQKVSSQLQLRQARQTALTQQRQTLARLEDHARRWPDTVTQLERLRGLQQQDRMRTLLDRCAEAEEQNQKICALEEELSRLPCPAQEEIARARENALAVTRLENSLCGMNLMAKLSLQQGYRAELRSLRTGALLPVQDQPLAVKEAVCLRVPGVLELELYPADLDVEAATRELSARREALQELLARYAVSTVEALALRAGEVRQKSDRLQLERLTLQRILNGEELASLEQQARAITEPVADRSAIDARIAALRRPESLSELIAIGTGKLSSYERDYVTQEALQEKVLQLRSSVAVAEEELARSEQGLEEFAAVQDPARHLQRLQLEMEQARARREEALKEKSAAQGRLENALEGRLEDPAAAVESARRLLEERKTELRHWLHIREVYQRLRQSLRSEPFRDIAGYLADYLDLLSDGQVTTELAGEDRMDVRVYSAERRLDYDRLSEGTKQTVLLAFRLAVLEHLFPEGGGLLVLDDPLTDLDPERTAQACKLILAAAKRHQILFLTCKPSYFELLPGSHISL